MPLTNAERELLTYTLLGEARGEGAIGMYAVAEVIRWRSQSPLYPDNAVDVVSWDTQPWQFTTNGPPGVGNQETTRAEVPVDSPLFETAEAIVRRVIEAEVDPPSITGRALNYHALNVAPYWGTGAAVDIGDHRFYTRVAVDENQDVASVVAGVISGAYARRRVPAGGSMQQEDVRPVRRAQREQVKASLGVVEGVSTPILQDWVLDGEAFQTVRNIPSAVTVEDYAAIYGSGFVGLGHLMHRTFLSPAAPNRQQPTADQRIAQAKLETRYQQMRAQLSARGSLPAGMIEQGNINLTLRPQVVNADGSISTVRSASFNIDGREVLVPTIGPQGQELSEDEALDLYRATGKHLGVFSSPEAATAYSKRLSEQMHDNASMVQARVGRLSDEFTPNPVKPVVAKGPQGRGGRRGATPIEDLNWIPSAVDEFSEDFFRDPKTDRFRPQVDPKTDRFRPITASEILVERIGRLSDEFVRRRPAGTGEPISFAPFLPPDVQRITDEGLRVREVPLWAVGPDGKLRIIPTEAAVRPGPARSMGEEARIRIAEARRVAAIPIRDPMRADTAAEREAALRSPATGPVNPRSRSAMAARIRAGDRLESPEGLPEPISADPSFRPVSTSTADQIINEQRREQLANRAPPAIPKAAAPAPTAPKITRADSIGTMPRIGEVRKIAAQGMPSLNPLGAGSFKGPDPELLKIIRHFAPTPAEVPTPIPRPSTGTRALPPATTTGAKKTGSLSDEFVKPAKVTTQTVTTQKPVTTTIMVENPDYKVFMDQLAADQRMTPTGAVIDADMFRAINDPNYRPPKRKPPPPRLIPKTVTTFETVTTEIVVPGGTGRPAPARTVAPQVVFGAATRNPYTVGQDYAGSQGYVLRMGADGRFVRTGERTEGFEGMSPSGSYDKAAAAARSSQEFGGSLNSFERTQQRNSEEESRARSMQSTIG